MMRFRSARPRAVLVDASAWIALANDDEAHHRLAVVTYTNLLHARTALVTTCLVLAGAHVLLRRRLGYQPAMDFVDRVNQSDRIEVVYVDPLLEVAAKEILRRYRDHDFSLADAVSFALMRARGISHAFTLDQHFATAGFIMLPSR